MLLVTTILAVVCFYGASADPYSPFNRNRAHQDNYHPLGVPLGPQKFASLRNHPSLDPVPENKFDVVYQWQIMDFEYPSHGAKRQALNTG